MLKNVLPAKVSPPRLFDVVPRERLFALLDDNRGRPLLWIAGPPGAGKTTLVATWLETRSIPSIWYQIDAEDADPAALFDHLARGRGSVAPESDAVLPRFSAEHLGDVTAFARLYFRALFASLPPGAALVLDNYQDAPEGAALHEIVQECARQAPRGSTIVAVSRTDAPPSFVAFTANGSMTTIGWDRLQLTQEEVNAICAKRGVTEGWLVQALHQQSQGWAAGITLMLERLEHTDGNARELPSETRESVFTYFADLIFDQTSPQRRAILLAVAFLPRVSAELAVQLSGDAEAPVCSTNSIAAACSRIVVPDRIRRTSSTRCSSIFCGRAPAPPSHQLFCPNVSHSARQPCSRPATSRRPWISTLRTAIGTLRRR